MAEQLSLLPDDGPDNLSDAGPDVGPLAWAVAVGDTITTRQGEGEVTGLSHGSAGPMILADYGSGGCQAHGLDEIRSIRRRRYSRPGQASGWIEERIGNRKRKTPSVSYYYGWQDATGKHKRYIPAGKLWRIQQMVEVEQRSVAEIMAVLCPIAEEP